MVYIGKRLALFLLLTVISSALFVGIGRLIAEGQYRLPLNFSPLASAFPAFFLTMFVLYYVRLWTTGKDGMLWNCAVAIAAIPPSVISLQVFGNWASFPQITIIIPLTTGMWLGLAGAYLISFLLYLLGDWMDQPATY